MSTGVEGKGDDEINFFTSLRKRKLDMQPGVGLSRGLSDRGEQDLVACMYVSCVGGTERTWERELMAGSEAMGWKRRD